MTNLKDCGIEFILSIFLGFILIMQSVAAAGIPDKLEILGFNHFVDSKRGVQFNITVNVKDQNGVTTDLAIDFINKNNKKHKLFCYNRAKSAENDIKCDLEVRAPKLTIPYGTRTIISPYFQTRYLIPGTFYPSFGFWKTGEVEGQYVGESGNDYDQTGDKFKYHLLDFTGVWDPKIESVTLEITIDGKKQIFKTIHHGFIYFKSSNQNYMIYLREYTLPATTTKAGIEKYYISVKNLDESQEEEGEFKVGEEKTINGIPIKLVKITFREIPPQPVKILFMNDLDKTITGIFCDKDGDYYSRITVHNNEPIYYTTFEAIGNSIASKKNGYTLGDACILIKSDITKGDCKLCKAK